MPIRAIRLLGILLSVWACLGLTGAVSAQEVFVPKEQQQAFYEAGQAADAPEVGGVINLYSTMLGYSYPKDLVPVYQVKQPGIFMMEMIPFGEDLKTNWSKMFTIQAFAKQVIGPMTAQAFAMRVANGVRGVCPDTAVFEDLGAVEIEGATAHRVAFGCGGLSSVGGTSAGEMTIMQATKRAGDILVVQYAHRGEPYDTANPLLGEDEKQYYASLLDQIELADNPNASAN